MFILNSYISFNFYRHSQYESDNKNSERHHPGENFEKRFWYLTVIYFTTLKHIL